MNDDNTNRWGDRLLDLSASALKWFIVREEGSEREMVCLADLRRLAPQVPIFGAQLGRKYVVYDRILAKHGHGPYRIVNLDDFTMETRAA